MYIPPQFTEVFIFPAKFCLIFLIFNLLFLLYFVIYIWTVFLLLRHAFVTRCLYICKSCHGIFVL